MASTLEAIRGWGFELPNEPNIEERIGIAVGLAGSVGCDAFVTESSGLRRIAEAFAKESNPLAPETALSVIGLHLRLREDFVIRQNGPSRYQTNGTGYYSLVAHDLLREAERWTDCCPGTEVLLGPSTAGLARAVPSRVSRALRARDRMHGYLLRIPSEAAVDEALFYFDGFLVALAGAFDAAAQVAARAYKVSRDHISWRDTPWRNRLVAVEPSLSSVLDQRCLDVIEMLFALRNTVHGETFHLIGLLHPNGEVANYHVSVPERNRQRLLDAAERLGGLESWGLRNSEATSLSFDLGRYVETLLPNATATLNSIMAAIDVDRFDDPDDELIAAPSDVEDLTCEGRAAASTRDDVDRDLPIIRLLAGIG
ncbi:MAG TPA: hypothetical protein VFF06_31540 [Polyangia bacterium]|nr:hypothetical protein [Polyangia bacterium]